MHSILLSDEEIAYLVNLITEQVDGLVSGHPDRELAEMLLDKIVRD